MITMAKSSVGCVGLAVGVLGSLEVDYYGEPGAPIEDSVFVRAYCYLCNEPIRVPRRMIGFPNACSVCNPNYRGRPGVVEAERNFWFEQFYQDMADRNVNDSTNNQT